MLMRGAFFVSKRLQRAMAALVCLMLAQAILALATPDAPAAVGVQRIAISR